MSTSRKYTFHLESNHTPVYIDDPEVPISHLFLYPGMKRKQVLVPRKRPVETPEEIYEVFKKPGYFHLDYLCVYTKSTERYLYVVFREILSHSNLWKFLMNNRRFGIIDTWKSKNFEGGEITFERGERPIPPVKRRRVSTSRTPPVDPTDVPRVYTHNPDAILIGEDMYIKSDQESTSDNYVFHAVWGATNGCIWKPMAWVGPTVNITPSSRTSVPPEITTKLLKDQNHSCKFCHSDVSVDPKHSNCDVDHIIPLHIGGSNSISNLQILCVPCHRRKSALERRKVRNNMVVPTSVKLEPGVVYIARDDSTGTICEPTVPQERNPKEFLKSGEDGLFKLV